MKKGVSKEVIIQRSAKIFVENGIKTTMDELSRLLKISKRTIYEQFEDKTDLVRECILLLIDNLPKIPPVQKNISNQIPNICQIIFENAIPHFGKRNKFVKELKIFYPELYDEYLYPVIQNIEKSLLDNVKRSARDGYIRSDIIPEIYLPFLMQYIFLVTEPTDNYISKYSHISIFQNTILPYFRGMLTEKGIREFDENIKNYIK